MDAENNEVPGFVAEEVVAKVADERKHNDIELAVDRGIAAAMLEGIPKALEMMTEAGVPREISLRVLNSKSRRRASDWK